MGFPNAPLLLLVPSGDSFDMPPKWDGQTIEWSAWEVEPWTTLLLHTDPECCGVCGSVAPRVQSHGIALPRPGETFKSVRQKRAQRSGRTYDVDVEVPAWRVLKLVARRCVDCRHDTVYDISTGEFWDLDASDYGPEGSTA